MSCGGGTDKRGRRRVGAHGERVHDGEDGRNDGRGRLRGTPMYRLIWSWNVWSRRMMKGCEVMDSTCFSISGSACFLKRSTFFFSIILTAIFSPVDLSVPRNTRE